MTAIGVSPQPSFEPGSVSGYRRLWNPRHVAFWLLAILAAVSAAYVVFALVGTARTSTIVLLTGLVWVAWAVIAYWLVGRADLFSSVPGGVRIAAFAWGALCLLYSGTVLNLLARVVPVPDQWSAAVHAPVPEELAKLLGVVLIAFVVPKVFSRPLGALVCGMLAGLGFTFLENWFQTNGSLAAGGEEPLVSMFLTKGLFFAPWAHSVFVGLSALGIWYVVAHPRRSMPLRLLVAAGFFLAAVALHFLNDAVGLAFGDMFAKIGIWFAELLLLIGLIWWARRAEHRWFDELTSGGALPGLEPEQVHELGTRKARRAARRAGVGREVEQTRLAYANAYSDRDDETADHLARRLATLSGST